MTRNHLSTALALGLLVTLALPSLAAADQVTLKDGEELSGRILGVTDSSLFFMAETQPGIRVQRKLEMGDVVNLKYERPQLEELQRRLRQFERENRSLQESLDNAVDQISELRARTSEMQEAMASMREKLDQYMALPSLTTRATPEPGSAEETFPPLVGGEVEPPTENPNVARIIAGDVSVERSSTTGITYVRGRLLNAGRSRAKWIKVRVSGLNINGETTIQEVGYSRQPILDPGDSSTFSVALDPPEGTVDFAVQPEWND